MSSYKDLNLDRIKALSERARSLAKEGNNHDTRLKGYILLEKLYKELEPFRDEIESTRDFNLTYIISAYEKEARYVLEAEEELEPQPKKPNKPEYIGILPDELIDEAVTKGSSERPKKRGRRSVPFSECLTERGKDMIKALYKAMKGKIGKEAALIITVAMENGLITKPAYSAVRNEFGDIGSRSGFNNYAYKLERFTKVEIEGAKRQLGL